MAKNRPKTSVNLCYRTVLDEHSANSSGTAQNDAAPCITLAKEKFQTNPCFLIVMNKVNVWQCRRKPGGKAPAAILKPATGGLPP